MADFNPLRPITQRLTSTSVTELPHIAYFLASAIANCGPALQNTWGQTASKSNDNAVHLHKLRTRISSLLQERSPEGRFTAVVLIKAVVEAGGREILSSSESWVRGLLAILGKNDPVSTKKLCLITLTRIFLMTQQYPTLVREITTPLLPTFITASLTLIKPNVLRTNEGETTLLSPLLEPVLRSLSELLPYHPTIFRQFITRLNSIGLHLIGDASTPLVVADVASDLLTTLHFSASRNAAGAEWTQTCKCLISSCHIAAYQVFRSVIEDWEPSEQNELSASVDIDYDSKVKEGGPDPLGLPAWIGVHDGTQRLVKLLRILMKFLSHQSAQQVSCPIGSIVDLTARLTAVTAIADARASQFSVRINAEVGRDERDELWMELPTVHIATLDLLATLLQSFAEAVVPIARSVFDQTMSVFGAEQENEALRIATYRLIEQLLSIVGFSLTRSDVDVLARVVKRCCADLIPEAVRDTFPSYVPSTERNGSRPGGSAPIDVDSFANSQKGSLKSHPSERRESVYSAAFRLLPCFLSALPATVVPHSLRTEIDRTAILVQNRKALLASVLNPPPANKGQLAPPSIMPFLARASSGELDIEALLRPRMPLIHNDRLLQSGGDVDMSTEGNADNAQSPNRLEEMTETLSAHIPEGPDLLDRLEHSLENSPVDTKHEIDASGTKRTALEADGLSAYQYLSEPTTKRNLAAMNDNEADNDQQSGDQDIAESYLAAASSATDVNKRRRLESDTRILSSENAASTKEVEMPGLHESKTHVAPGRSSLHVSAQEEQLWEETNKLSATLKEEAPRIPDDDDESDFEIPEIIDSSENDEE